MSAHPNHPTGTSGGNPDYYAETSSVAGAGPSELSGGTPPHHPAGSHATSAADQPPQYQDQVPQYQEQVFPPPPPGPPPSGGQQHQPAHQDYYPPPPPGPPPNQTYQAYHPLQSHPTNNETLPGYTETPGLHVQGDEKLPVLPPRPGSRPGSSQGSAPYFAPPPTAAEAGPSSGEHHAAQASAATAAAGAPVSGSGAKEAEGGKKKKTFGERFYDWSVKAGVPINKVTNKLGSEAFWPTSMDKECDKAARILKSFCKDGFYTTPANHPPPSPGHATNPGPTPNPKAKTLVKVPAAALKQARGLAVFTVFRTGLHISGASGSGVVVARLPDGSWSPPSGFLVHTLGAGFMVGLDIYDCVCVLNTDEAVRAFTRPRLSLGGEIAVVAGPVGAGASLDAALGAGKPVWSYMKSRGFYAGVQADGTVIVQRPDANAAFYGEKGVTPERILRGEIARGSSSNAAPAGGAGVGAVDNAKGEVVMWPQGARHLVEVLKSAQGEKADERVVDEVGTGPTPGDLAGTDGVAHEKEKEGGLGGGKGSVRYA
ncbi:hypothetical protein JX266_002373 [Neoarthrinium moseri]|nr:hypothetical protein JX266_002373 [Neoarthrinium moseri]